MEKQEKTWMYLLNIVACFAVIILHCCTPAFFSYKEGIRWDIANVLQQVFKFAVPCFFMMSGAHLLDYYKRYLQKKTVKSSSTFYCLEYYMVCIFNNKSWI